MIKKSKKNEPLDMNMVEQPISEVLTENYMPYAMSVIISRSLPEIDGFKPSHRKILYTMYDMGLLNGNRTKSANVVGTTMKLNPHGDQAIYETLVRLTKDNESLLLPFIDSKGNFGKVYSRDMDYAASRYCVTGSTLIPTNKGIMPIKDIVANSKLNMEYKIDIMVKSIDGKNQKATKFFNSGKHDVYNITLQNGMSIEGTANHPLMVLTNSGNIEWKLINDINIDDKCLVDIDDKNSLFGINNDLLEAKMLGAMISEGYITTQNRIGINNKDYNMIKPVFNFITKNITHNSKIIFNSRGYYEFCIASPKFQKEFINKYNYKKKAKNKIVPQCVLSGTKEYQKTFLKYLFEGDGSVRNSKNGNEIIYSSYSINLIKQIQIMLLNFGIHSYIKYSKAGKEIKLNITSLGILKFKKEIGFLSERKNQILKSIEAKRPANNSYTSTLEIANKIKREYKTKNSYNSVYMAYNFLEEYDNKEIYDLLTKYLYVPVVKKEFKENQIVYSIKVDNDCHSFTGNGFINHNTEIKLLPICKELFSDINMNSVDFVPNYDNTTTEPRLIPTPFPNILSNSTLGIAVGMASNICSFNFEELCKATIQRIKSKRNDLLDIMPGPDFTTKGTIISTRENMKEIYETGRGSFYIKGKYRIIKELNCIEIYEIPYTTTIEGIMEGIVSNVKNGKLKEINDVRDETDLKGLKITIDYKRNTNPELLIKKITKLTKFQDSFSCNFNVLIDNNPQVLGVYKILDKWIEWRKECIIRTFQYKISEKNKRLHLLEGLSKILLNINKAIKIIRETEDDSLVIKRLMDSFKIDKIQAEYVADIKLRNLNKNYILNTTKNIDSIKLDIEEYNKIVSNEKLVEKEIINELNGLIKKHSCPRKSNIIVKNDIDNFVIEDIIEDYNVNIYITNEGYIKKVPLVSLKTSPIIKIKDGDLIISTIQCKNKDELLCFTDKGNLYKIRVSDIKDTKPSEIGDTLYNLLSIKNEKIIFTTITNDYSKSIVICFENGKVARFPLKVYQMKLFKKKTEKAFSISSKVINMFDTDGTDFFNMRNSIGKEITFPISLIPEKNTRVSIGIQVIKLNKDIVVQTFEMKKGKNIIKAIPVVGK